jgi:hypothetical protein
VESLTNSLVIVGEVRVDYCLAMSRKGLGSVPLDGIQSVQTGCHVLRRGEEEPEGEDQFEMRRESLATHLESALHWIERTSS